MNKNETIERIKAYRVNIDTLTNSAKALIPSREVSLCYTALQRSKMFLGKVLGELGTPTPYPQSDNAKSPVIEKQAEHTEQTVFDDVDLNGQVMKVKYLRAEIEKIGEELYEDLIRGDDDLEIVVGKSTEPQTDYYKTSLFKDSTYTSLVEAKMWLGMELDRISNEKK